MRTPLFICLLLLSLLAACGQTGPLYLPSDDSASDEQSTDQQ